MGIDFVLMGKAKEVFAEIAFMEQLERATGYVLAKYQPWFDAFSKN